MSSFTKQRSGARSVSLHGCAITLLLLASVASFAQEGAPAAKAPAVSGASKWNRSASGTCSAAALPDLNLTEATSTIMGRIKSNDGFLKLFVAGDNKGSEGRFGFYEAGFSSLVLLPTDRVSLDGKLIPALKQPPGGHWAAQDHRGFLRDLVSAKRMDIEGTRNGKTVRSFIDLVPLQEAIAAAEAANWRCPP
jgi:hypothetical protein